MDDEVVQRVVVEAGAVLGLDPAAARDPRAVKRAYATLLKRHRPDQDPEGFRRIRDAYEALTAIHANVSEPVGGATEAAVPAAVPAPVPVDDPPDDALAQAIAKLAALGSGTRDATRILAGQQVWRLACAGRLERAVPVLMTAFTQEPHLLVQVLGDDGLREAIGRGHAALVIPVLEHWAGNDIPRLATFTKGLLNLGKEDKESEAFIMLALHLTGILALREPRVANELLNRLFTDLPPHLREATLEIEQRITIGRELLDLPSAARRFVWELLDRDHSTPAPPMPAHVRAALEALPPTHVVRAVLEDLMPGLALGFSYAGTARTAEMAIHVRKDSYESARDSDSSDWVWGKVGIGVILLIVFCATVNELSKPMPTISIPPPVVTPTAPPPPPQPLPEPSIEVEQTDQIRSPVNVSESPQTRAGGQLDPSKLTPQQRQELRKLIEAMKSRPRSGTDQGGTEGAGR